MALHVPGRPDEPRRPAATSTRIPPSPSVLARIGIGLFFALIAGALRWLLIPLTGSGAPFVVFFGAVLVASTLGGTLAGIVSAVAGGGMAIHLFLARAGFTVSQVLSQYFLFLAEACVVGWVTGGFFASRKLSQFHLKALARSDERYQLALRATSDLIWDWNASTGHMDFGEGLVSALGYPTSFMHTTRDWWISRMHDEDQAHVSASLSEACATRQTLWEQEYRFAKEDGVYVDILDKAYIVYNSRGQVARMIGAMQNVTQKRNDQRVLREAEAKLRLVTDALPALIAYVDQDGRHTLMNAEYERWFGLTRQELAGRKTAEIIPGTHHSHEGVPTAIRSVLAGETVRFEENLIHPTRGKVPANFTFVPDFDEQRRVRGFITLAQDVSEQKKSERELREREEHYRLLSEVVPQMIFEARPNGTLSYVNDRWVRYSGLDQSALLGSGWIDAMHPETQERVRHDWEQAIARGTDYETEVLLYYQPDNSYRWHLMRAMVLLDDRNVLRKWIGCLVDIHERKKSEQELQALANYIPQLAWIADPRGNVYWLNQRWFDYSGKAFDSLAKQGWLALVEESHRFVVARELSQAFADGKAFEGTFPVANENGEHRWFLTRAIPIFDDSGRLSRWFGTSTDINDQLETQNRLQKAQKELETAVRARDEFMSIASHELKTPLTSLQLAAQMAQRNLRSDPARACETHRVRKLVTQTEKSVARLNRLVDDMLDGSRIAMGKLSFKLEEFDLAELVTEVVDRMVPQVQATGGRISIDARHAARGKWDRFRIEQVVINLLTNAMRYGGGSPIEIGVDFDQDQAWFHIRDYGPGIAKSHQERIFQQYERATPHSSISGLGLGLFICKEIVQRHGGCIELDSAPGEGADFRVNLPRECGSEAPVVSGHA